MVARGPPIAVPAVRLRLWGKLSRLQLLNLALTAPLFESHGGRKRCLFCHFFYSFASLSALIVFSLFFVEDILVWVSEVNRELLGCGAFCRATPFFAAALFQKLFEYQNYEGGLVLSSPSNFWWYFVEIKDEKQRQSKAQWFGY
jgi:hypothetical protein